MKNFYEKDNYSISDIQELILNDVEESTYLDFKSSEALAKVDSKRNEISKDVAAFANSEGGILIYGVKEENHRAKEITPIDGTEYTKEWIEHIINSTIQRRIEGILIIPIRIDGDIKRSIYIVKIPQSYDVPHISRDKRFYKRFNFESVAMEEHEIRNLYGKKLKSKLAINQISMRLKENEYETDKHEIEFECQVANDGEITENNYKVNVILDDLPKGFGISYDRDKSNYEYTHLDKNRIKVSASLQHSLYPNETMTGIRFLILVPKDLPQDEVDDIKYVAYLLYSNGEDKLEGDFSKISSRIAEIRIQNGT